MNAVKFIHSNLKTEVNVFAELVIAVYYLSSNQTTAILGNAGALIPVEGTVEQVTKAIETAKTSTKKSKGK